MKRIIFYLTALVLFANLGYAQNDTLYVMKNNDIISLMPVDSVDKINLDTQNSTLFIYNGTSLLCKYSKYDVDSVVFERPSNVKNDIAELTEFGTIRCKLYGYYLKSDTYTIYFGSERFGEDIDVLISELDIEPMDHVDFDGASSCEFNDDIGYYELRGIIKQYNKIVKYLRIEIRRHGTLLRSAEWIKE